MRTPQQSGDDTAAASERAARPPHTERPPAAEAAREAVPGVAPGAAPHHLLSLQRTVGNAATSRAVRRTRHPSARPALPDIEERTETGFVLPSYLLNLQAGGLSSAYGLTGHEFVRHAVSAVVGHADGTVAELAGELSGRPESFFGQGRAFAVQGRTGNEWYDVTVSISRAPGDRPPVFQPDDLMTDAPPGGDGVPQALLNHPEGKDTKLDVHHNSAATVGSSADGSSSTGAGGLAFGLAPVVPGLWLGAAGTLNAQPWQSSCETRRQTNVAEPRVLRSDKGTVEVRREVRYEVRIQRHGTDDEQTFGDSGTLTQRVPTEHLVPVGTEAPVPPHLGRRPAGELPRGGRLVRGRGHPRRIGQTRGRDGAVEERRRCGGGLGLSSGASQRGGTVGRGRLGMKTVADASAAVARMRVPIRARLELYRGNERVDFTQLDHLTLTHRVLRADLDALSRAELPAADAPLVAQGAHAPAPTAAADPSHWRASGARLPMEAQVNGFQGAAQVRQLLATAVRQAGGGARFADTGQAAAYALNEAVSTEWLIAALPLLTSAGVELPPVHASGAEGQNLRASLHARLRNGRVLGVGDKMAFETIGQSHLEAPRPTQTDGQSSADHSRAACVLAGGGVLNADQFRLNQLLGHTGGSGGAADAMANASGSMPVHKPKARSVLVQFTLDVRAVAQVTGRVRTSRTDTAVRETTLSRPVVIRVPEAAARAMVTGQPTHVSDDDHHLVLPPTPAPPPAP